jgi:hypothetical protein
MHVLLPLLLDIVFRESDLLPPHRQRAASPLREAVRARGCGCGESCIPADRGREKSQSTIDGIFWKLWCNMTGVLLPVVQQAGIGLLCLPLDRARESRHAEMKFFD